MGEIIKLDFRANAMSKLLDHANNGGLPEYDNNVIAVDFRGSMDFKSSIDSFLKGAREIAGTTCSGIILDDLITPTEYNGNSYTGYDSDSPYEYMPAEQALDLEDEDL